MNDNSVQITGSILLKRSIRRRWITAAVLLCSIVALCTAYVLILPAIAMTRQTFCGMVEHTEHTDECYSSVKACPYGTESDEIGSGVCICGKAEDGEHVHSDECFHVHTEECFAKVLTCRLELHTHTLLCCSDPSIVESQEAWEQSVQSAEKTGVWADDLVSVAKTQLGYSESTVNFTVLDDGVTEKGYTRYGDWYGIPYGDWCAMFVSFCLNYSDIPGDAFPYNAGCTTWVRALSEKGMFEPSKYGTAQNAAESDYCPKKGDIVFFDYEGAGLTGHVAIVSDVRENDSGEVLIDTIEGNYCNSVMQCTYAVNDPLIYGYGVLPEKEMEEEKTEPVQEEEVFELSYSGEDYEIVLRYTAAARLPEETELLVREILHGTEEYEKNHAQTIEKLLNERDAETEEELNISFSRMFDITLSKDGAEIEPAAPVDVEIRYAQPIECGDSAVIETVHFGNDGEMELLPTTPLRDGETVVGSSHTQEGFSPLENIVLAGAATYTVWLDGTCGDLMALDGADNTCYTNVGSSFVLPETWKSTPKYEYKLNGWYDIRAGIYYEPGATATITRNTVFYADWVANSYDIGRYNSDVADSVDTNSYITTRVFDYNVLFNVQSRNLVESNDSPKISTKEHHEDWQEVKSGNVLYNNAKTLDFFFIDWDTSDDSKISYAFNNSKYNSYNSSVTSGILANSNSVSGKNLINVLFDKDTEVIGKTYLGEANYLFQYDKATGYTYYDSKKNAASYNQSEERFYVYNYLERAEDSRSDSGEGKYSDFLPLNSPYANTNGRSVVDSTDSKVAYKYDSKDSGGDNKSSHVTIDYLFGMSVDIDFYLPDEPGTANANRSDRGSEMMFKMTGDDDIWVFIDGKLVMDLGGIHKSRSGTINCSTGSIDCVLGDGTASTTSAKLSDFGISSGQHKLTVYYLERGSSQSNCAIYFNIAPRYGLDLQKIDYGTQSALSGAEFTIYSDADCTVPAELWDSQDAYYRNMDDPETDKPKNVFSVDENGLMKVWGLTGNRKYYIVETKAPDSTYPVNGDGVMVELVSGGTDIFETFNVGGGEVNSGFTVCKSQVDNVKREASLTLTNKAIDTTSVSVEKKWADETKKTNSVFVYLTVDGKKTLGYDIELSDANNWQYTWNDVPKYKSDGVSEIVYNVFEIQPEGFISSTEVKDNVYTITNTPIAEDKLISVKVNKLWLDKYGDPMTPPEGTSITVKLLADGVDTGRSAVLPVGDKWSCSFDKLSSVDASGKTIAYSVREIETDGFDTSYSAAKKQTEKRAKWDTVTSMDTESVYRFVDSKNIAVFSSALAVGAKAVEKDSADQQWKIELAGTDGMYVKSVAAGGYLASDGTDVEIAAAANENSVWMLKDNCLYNVKSGTYLTVGTGTLSVSDAGTVLTVQKRSEADALTGYVIDVTNKEYAPLSALPSTGGEGTEQLCTVGIALTAAALVCLTVSYKKKNGIHSEA